MGPSAGCMVKNLTAPAGNCACSTRGCCSRTRATRRQTKTIMAAAIAVLNNNLGKKRVRGVAEAVPGNAVLPDFLRTIQPGAWRETIATASKTKKGIIRVETSAAYALATSTRSLGRRTARGIQASAAL